MLYSFHVLEVACVIKLHNTEMASRDLHFFFRSTALAPSKVSPTHNPELFLSPEDAPETLEVTGTAESTFGHRSVDRGNISRIPYKPL